MCFFSSYLASSSHSQALSPQSLVFRSQSRKESGPCFYFITCDTPGHKRKPLSLLLFYSTLSPLHSRQTEPGHALRVALHIMMSLKSLFSSLPLNTPPLLLCSPSLALSFSVRCFSHPALLCCQSLRKEEIKHRYRVLACNFPDAELRPSHSLFYSSFFCQCLRKRCSAHLLLQFILCLLLPLTSLSPQSLAFLQITRRPQKNVFTIFILHQSLESLDPTVLPLLSLSRIVFLCPFAPLTLPSFPQRCSLDGTIMSFKSVTYKRGQLKDY